MATDATGTPSTNFSIPKYLTSADAPSGKGLNAIVDFIDTLLKTKFPGFSSAITGTPSSSTYLRGDGAWATVAAGPVTYRKATTKAVNSTTSATDLLNGEITIAAGVMGTTGVVRVTIWGDWVNNIGSIQAPPRFQVLFGGTTLIDTGTSGTVTSGAGRRPWNIDFIIANQNANNVQSSRITGYLGCVPSGTDVFNAFTTGTGIYSESNAAASYTGAWIQGLGTPGALDTTSSKALLFNVINGNSGANYETRLQGALIEVI